jgi:predicted TIM-barrel fold metal-dependent hydrolase
VWTAAGPRAPGSSCFDPFWARASEAGITVVIHTGNAGYSSNGYDEEGFGLASVGMDDRPSVTGLALERAANDFLLDLAYKKVFERFPKLRIASIENGSGFLPNLLRQLEHARNRNPWHFTEDPLELFRTHVWINPFWEDDIAEVIGWMGAEQVIFGSDWPHMEGLPHPRGIMAEIGGLDDRTRDLFLRENARRLTRRQA